jgi:hypothetical protein
MGTVDIAATRFELTPLGAKKEYGAGVLCRMCSNIFRIGRGGHSAHRNPETPCYYGCRASPGTLICPDSIKSIKLNCRRAERLPAG